MERGPLITTGVVGVALCTAAAALVVDQHKSVDQTGSGVVTSTTGYAMVPTSGPPIPTGPVRDLDRPADCRLIDTPTAGAAIHVGVVADAATGCRYIAVRGDGHRRKPRMERRGGAIVERCLGPKTRVPADAYLTFGDRSPVEGWEIDTMRDLTTGCEYLLSHDARVDVAPRMERDGDAVRQRCDGVPAGQAAADTGNEHRKDPA